MFLLNVIKLVIIFIFVYFLYSLVRFIFKIVINLKKSATNINNPDNAKKTESGEKGSVIELDKDQYKVE